MANIIRIEILNDDSNRDFNETDEGKRPTSLSSSATAGITGGSKDASSKVESTIIEAPILDDITLSAKSNLSKISEVVPIADKVIDFVKKASGTVSNEIGNGVIDLINKFDAQKWAGTEPFRVSIKVMLYTQRDPFMDVYKKATLLQGQSILSKSSDGLRYITPGASLQTLKAFGSQKGTTQEIEEVLRKSKLVAFEIPGVIYVPLAIVENAVPTFSKEKTESGYPLMASVDLQIVSVYPANTEYFDYAISRQKSNSKIGASEFLSKWSK